MATIVFKAKVSTSITSGRSFVKVPKLTSAHYNRNELRTHRKFGSYANSDLIGAVITRAMRDMGVKSEIYLDDVPIGVHIDNTGFLAIVTVTIN